MCRAVVDVSFCDVERLCELQVARKRLDALMNRYECRLVPDVFVTNFGVELWVKNNRNLIT